ncbi:MAG: hypothetical protein WAW23_05750 [Candidatus Methanoperedens sp.]
MKPEAGLENGVLRIKKQNQMDILPRNNGFAARHLLSEKKSMIL